mmetsp:Transcript_18608/g.20229  ORF Transcript_18608/g.20229 Transcript_18608/m.20229 type:complete len:534 (+) Transcript_18608:62-1663(+)|eukprot:gene5190-5559_t
MSNPCCELGYCALDGLTSTIICCDCGKPIINEDILMKEREWMEKITDDSEPKDMITRGVSIEFLLEFTKQNDLWDKSTAWVTRNIIQPRTIYTRERYVEFIKTTKLDLPELRNLKHGPALGIATTFVSHCWNGSWGTLVAAVSEQADLDKFVWIDIFAVRQWPSEKSIAKKDLNFRAAIKSLECTSFVLVCCSHKDITEMAVQAQTSRNMKAIDKDAKRAVAFFRAWCLVEIAEAVENSGRIAFALKAGKLKHTSEGYFFEPDPKMISNLFYFVDIRNAEASYEHDRIRILNEIGENADEINRAIRGVCAGSRNASRYPEVQAAGCGHSTGLRTVLADPQKYMTCVAGAGYLSLLKEILELKDIDVNAKDEFTCTSLIQAARGGHYHCIELLLSKKADLTIVDKDNLTPYIAAAIGGHIDCLELLEKAKADIHSVNKNSSNAITYACVGGHYRCLKYLIDKGLDINARSSRTGWTPLAQACIGNHIECVKILVERPDCDLLMVDNDELTPYQNALKYGHSECAELIRMRTGEL